MEGPCGGKDDTSSELEGSTSGAACGSPAGSMTADTCGRGSSSTHAGNRCLHGSRIEA